MSYAQELSAHYAAVHARLCGPMLRQFVPAPTEIANANPAHHAETLPCTAATAGATRESRGDCGFDPGSQGSVVPPPSTERERIVWSIRLARNLIAAAPRGSKKTLPIIRAVAAVYHVRPRDITGPRRLASLIEPRHVAMTITKQLSGYYSLPAIGRAFGGRDHTTVIYAINKYGDEGRRHHRRADMTTRCDEAFEKYRKAKFGVVAAYPLDAYTFFGAGWNAAIDEVIRVEQSRAAPDQNLIRDLEYIKHGIRT